MNMFSMFDKIPSMDIFKILRKQNVTDGPTHGQRENSKSSTNTVCGGIIMSFVTESVAFSNQNHLHLKCIVAHRIPW